jgi:acetoin utilization deacetylase AcuC-like enzyme
VRVVRSDGHRSHHCAELEGGRLIASWESPRRADVVDEATDDAQMACQPPDSLDRALVESVHDPSYVEFLETAWSRWIDAGHTEPCAMGFAWPSGRVSDIKPHHIDGLLGYHSFAADCSIGEGTWAAVTSSAACAHTAVDLVVDGASSAFARCRPPGHHASRDQFGGYCFLNNAAIAAQRLRDRDHERVAVLDIDYHHGNGTQDIFYKRADVLYASIHSDPRHDFPYFLGHSEEIGSGPGVDANRNLPLPPGTGAADWFPAFDDLVSWIVAAEATATVVSLGVDTFRDDPISRFTLESSDFTEIGRRLQRLASPVVFVLEGGYATEALGTNVVNVLQGYESG